MVGGTPSREGVNSKGILSLRCGTAKQKVRLASAPNFVSLSAIQISPPKPHPTSSPPRSMANAAAAAGAGADETSRVAGEVARVLDECRASLAVHPRKLRELAALRSSSGGRFLPAFCAALTPLFDLLRRSSASDRASRFAAAFASAAGGGDGFLEGFLRFLLAASAAAHRPARFRACQIISEASVGNL